MGMRLLDMPEESRAKRDAWRPFMCVEGPDELPSWGGVLEDMVDDFARHDPSQGKSPSYPRNIQYNALMPTFHGVFRVARSSSS